MFVFTNIFSIIFYYDLYHHTYKHFGGAFKKGEGAKIDLKNSKNNTINVCYIMKVYMISDYLEGKIIDQKVARFSMFVFKNIFSIIFFSWFLRLIYLFVPPI